MIFPMKPREAKDPDHFMPVEGFREHIIATEVQHFSPHPVIGVQRTDHHGGWRLKAGDGVLHIPPGPVWKTVLAHNHAGWFVY